MRLFLGRLAVFILGLLLVWGIYQTQPSIWESLRLRIQDMRYETSSALHPSDQIVFIDVDAASVDRYGRWPWKRSELAHGLERLAPAKVVVLDMVFSEKTEDEEDQQLADTLMRMGNTVGGFFFTDEENPLTVDAEDCLLLNGILSHIPTHAFEAYSGAGIEHSIVDILYAYAWNAAFSIMPDQDGMLRRYAVFFQYGDMVYPSLGTAALRLFWNQEIVYKKGYSLAFGDREFTADKRGQVLLHLYKPEDFKRYSFVDLTEGKIPPDQLEGKIAIVGISEAGVSDIVNTPLGRIPGPLVHASFLSNMIEKHLPQFQLIPCLVGTFLAALLPLIFIYIIRRSWLRFIAYLICLAGGIYGALYVYQTSQILLGQSYWALSFAIAILGQEGCRLLRQDYRVKLAKSSLSQSAAPILKEQLKDLEKKMDRAYDLAEVRICSIAEHDDGNSFNANAWKRSFGEITNAIGGRALQHKGLIIDSGSGGFRIIFGLLKSSKEPIFLAISFARELQDLWQPQYDGKSLDKAASEVKPQLSIYQGKAYLGIIPTASGGKRLDVFGPLTQAHEHFLRELPHSMSSRIFVGGIGRKRIQENMATRLLIKEGKLLSSFELCPRGEANEVIFEHYNKACEILKQGRAKEAKESVKECYDLYWDPLSRDVMDDWRWQHKE